MTSESTVAAATNGLQYVVDSLASLTIKSEEDPSKVLDWLKKLPDAIQAVDTLTKLASGQPIEKSTVRGGYELNPFELVNKQVSKQ
jgi:hypothetical protein